MGLVAEGLKIGKEFKMPIRAKVYARRPAPVKAIQMQTEFEVQVDITKTLFGKAGDYLILRSNGEFDRMSQEEFEKEYEAIFIGRRD